MIEVSGYKCLASKVVPRPWGNELRFSMVSDVTGREFNEVILIEDDGKDEKVLADIAATHLSKVDVTAEDAPIEKEVVIDKVSVERYLKENLYIKSDQTIDMIKSVMEKAPIAETPIEEEVKRG